MKLGRNEVRERAAYASQQAKDRARLGQWGNLETRIAERDGSARGLRYGEDWSRESSLDVFTDALLQNRCFDNHWTGHKAESRAKLLNSKKVSGGPNHIRNIDAIGTNTTQTVPTKTASLFTPFKSHRVSTRNPRYIHACICLRESCVASSSGLALVLVLFKGWRCLMRGGDRAALRLKNGQGAKGQGGLKASVAADAGDQSTALSGCVPRPNLPPPPHT